MTTNDYREELFSFFDSYVDFLARMSKDETEKLQALMSNSLPRIEHAISTAQANAKQIENFELKRVRLQEQAGFSGMTFSEIIEASPEEEQQVLEGLFHQFQTYVDDIKFHNTKSMRIAQTNMREIDPGSEVLREENAQSAASGAYIRTKENARTGQTTLLETKI